MPMNGTTTNQEWFWRWSVCYYRPFMSRFYYTVKITVTIFDYMKDFASWFTICFFLIQPLCAGVFNVTCPPSLDNAHPAVSVSGTNNELYNITCHDRYELTSGSMHQTINCSNEDWSFSHCKGKWTIRGKSLLCEVLFIVMMWLYICENNRSFRISFGLMVLSSKMNW